MSGFEVAGIVLGVFPLVVKGIGKLRDAMGPVVSLDTKEYQAKLDMLQTEIRIEETLFRDAYMKLLFMLVPPERVIEILADPVAHSTFRRDAETRRMLETRLGSRWKDYEKQMGYLENTLRALEAIIKKNDRSDQQGDWKSKFQQLFKQAGFNLSAEKISGLLRRLKDCNRQFARMIDSLNDLQRHSNPGQSFFHTALPPVARSYRSLRKSAIDIFDSMQSQMKCENSCTNAHSMDLVLDGSIVKFQSTRNSVSYATDLDYDELTIAIHGGPWTFRNAVGRCEFEVSRVTSTPDDTDSLCGFLEAQSAFHDWSTRPDAQEDAQQSIAPNMKPNVVTHMVRPSDAHFIKSVYDWKFSYCVAQKDITFSPNTCSLFDVLYSEQGPSIRARLCSGRMRDKFAAVLAMSVLCFQGTSWLSSSWSSKDILFALENPDDNPGLEAVNEGKTLKSFQIKDVLRPHINTDRPPDDGNGQSSSPAVSNRPLYSLGVVMVELILKRLPELSQPDNSVISAIDAVYNVLEEVCRTKGPVWRNVVRYCLFHEPSELDDVEFQRNVAENVVRPLSNMAGLQQYHSKDTTSWRGIGSQFDLPRLKTTKPALAGGQTAHRMPTGPS